MDKNSQNIKNNKKYEKMERNELIEKAKELFFYEKDTREGFSKEFCINGFRKDVGRVFAAKINESEKFPWRVSIRKLMTFGERIIDLTKDAASIATLMNPNTANKNEIAMQYAEVLKQEGRLALPLFLEHFLPDTIQNSLAMLVLNDFTEDEAKLIMGEIEDFHFEILAAQTDKGAAYLVETIPIFKGMNADDIFGSRMSMLVPISFEIPGTEDLSKLIRDFLLMTTVGFAERFSELPQASNPEQSKFNDRKVIDEWNSSSKMWYIHEEQWILNFLSHLAVAYISATGIRGMKDHMAITDRTYDKIGTNASIMNMN